MKKLLAFTVLFLTLSSTLPAMSQKHKKAHKTETGIIANFPKGTASYVLIPDSDPAKRYVVENLADEYKKEGLKVEYIGVEGVIPDNVRMVGIPFRVKYLQVKK